MKVPLTLEELIMRKRDLIESQKRDARHVPEGSERANVRQPVVGIGRTVAVACQPVTPTRVEGIRGSR